MAVDGYTILSPSVLMARVNNVIRLFENIPVSVWLPVCHASSRGLRRPLNTGETSHALQQLQQATTRKPQRKQSLHHYTWCKERLRQGDALGLWEVRRFLHDLKALESLNTPEWRYLQAYVTTQTALELTQALGCAPDIAAHLIETALLSTDPLQLPVPGTFSPDTC